MNKIEFEFQDVGQRIKMDNRNRISLLKLLYRNWYDVLFTEITVFCKTWSFGVTFPCLHFEVLYNQREQCRYVPVLFYVIEAASL